MMMTSSRETDDLRNALICWLTAAQSSIKANFDSLLMPIGIEGWCELPNGDLQKFPHRFYYKFSELDKLIFDNLEEWKNLEQCIADDAQFMRHTTDMIGSRLSGSHRLSAKDLCRRLIPVLKPISQTQVEAQLEIIDTVKIDELISEIRNEKYQTITIWPITGLRSNVEIELDNQTSFRLLNSEEKIHILNFGMIGLNHANNFKEDGSRWYGLVFKFQTEKFHDPYNNIDMDKVTEHFNNVQSIVEDFLVCGCLINDELVTHAGQSGGAPSIELGGILAMGAMGRGGSGGNMRFYFSDGSEGLSEERISLLTQLWKFVRSHKTSKVGRRVVNAARRLHYSETRTKADDMLIDLMIAAESLFLDDDKNGELRFRLSLNAARWNGGTIDAQKEVFKTMKAAYDLRSKVVHGSSAADVDLATTVNAIKPVIKGAILKTIKLIASDGKAPNWDDLVFQTEN